MIIRRALPAEVDAAFDIRRRVFMAEQGISEADEFDGLDDQAIHILAFVGDAPAGTTRLFINDGLGTIGRVAVLRENRGTGLGRELILYSMKELKSQGAHTAKLGAQVAAIGFYETLGFKVFGPEYLDADIPHRDMKCAL